MSERNIRIMLCDDHALFRSGVVSLLKDESNIFIVGEAVDGKDLIQRYKLLKPDIVITDISMPVMSGTDAVRILKEMYPQIKVLFLSMLDAELYIYFTLKVGGLGFLSKDVEKGELLYAINEIYNGRRYFGPLYNDEKLAELTKRYDGTADSTGENPDGLTDMEEKVLELISQGLSSQQIAGNLNMSKRTVDNHRTNIMQKFNISSLTGMIRFAITYFNNKKY